MATNVAKASFHFLWTKTHFPFSECHKWVFCEATTKHHFDNWINPISKNNRPLSMYISPIGLT
jgi:hypothetical protein